MIDTSKFEKLEKEDMQEIAGGTYEAYYYCTNNNCWNSKSKSESGFSVRSEIAPEGCPKCGSPVIRWSWHC